MATTAVVAGTAGAVHHHQEQKWANQQAQQQADQAAMQNQQDMAQMQQQMAQMQQQQAQAAMAPAPAPAPAAAAAPSLTDQLNSLAQMKASGILNDAEFEAAKAKLLAG
jgi:hypothetical protein